MLRKPVVDARPGRPAGSCTATFARAAVWLLAVAAAAACSSSSDAATPPGDLCGRRFREAASAALEASQSPPDCATHRLLVLKAPGDTFEGLGSILVGVAEALAEAHHGGRALVVGPREAQATVVRDARCPPELIDSSEGRPPARGYECLLRLPGACRWGAHVHREEAAMLGSGRWTPSPRVQESHPRRGGVALYAPPAQLRRLLPAGSSDADAAECWAGAVVARVMRLQGPVMERLEGAVRDKLGFDGPYAAVHLRAGDNALTDADFRDLDPTGKSRAYSNKPLPAAKAMGKLLKAHLARHGAPAASAAFLATDHAQPEKAKADLAKALGLPPAKVVVLKRYRTKHGSHNAAFAKTALEESNKLLMPYADVTAYLTKTKEQEEKDQEAVRMEALEDIWLLSHGAALAGAASSHFSVVSRLWAVGRGLAAASVPPAWIDGQDVASGLLSNGHYHGQVNSTNRLHHPEARMQKFLERFLEWPSTGREAAFRTHPERAVPLVHRGVFAQVAELWRSDTADAAFCTGCHLPDGCDTLALVDGGAALEGSMRGELAEVCWRRALMAPGKLPARARGAVAPGAVSEVARSNLAIVLQRMHNHGAQFRRAAQRCPVRGDGGGGGGDISTAAIRVHFEGERRQPHSALALAGIRLANALAARPGAEVSWADARGYRGHHCQDGAEALDERVAVVPFGGTLSPGTVLVRVTPPPFNLTLSPAAARTVVFAESEYLAAPANWSADGTPWAAVQATVAAPSRWAMEGLARSGIARSRLALVPYPVTAMEAAGPSARAEARAALGLGDLGERPAFVHVGDLGAFGNATRVLLTAFLALLTRWEEPWGPEPALVLADLSFEAGSKERFEAEVPEGLRAGRYISYFGQPFLTLARLKDVYRACDVFVTARSGEASAIRILEAAASGLALVVPAGGAAEEVVPPVFTQFAESGLVSTADIDDLDGGYVIAVDPNDLSLSMQECVMSDEKRRLAREIGPKLVALKNSQDTAADILLGVLQDNRWATPPV